MDRRRGETGRENQKELDDLQCELGRTMGSPNTDREVEDEGDFCRQDAWPKLKAIDEGCTEVGKRSAYGGGDCANNRRCSRSRVLYVPPNHGSSILYLVALLLTHEGQLLNLHRLSEALNEPTLNQDSLSTLHTRTEPGGDSDDRPGPPTSLFTSVYCECVGAL